jgi:hypothetical protein
MPLRYSYANGKQLIINHANTHSSATRAVIFAHSRFQPHRYVIGDANIPLPPQLKVYHYVRHNETIQFDEARQLYMSLQYANQPIRSPVKEYAGERMIKNYTLRPDMESFRWFRLPGGRFDLILPNEIMRTRDILDAVRAGALPYEELHFITCRAIRLSASWPI